MRNLLGLIGFICIGMFVFSCNPYSGCENPDPTTVEGIVVDDSTLFPIEGCNVRYEAESYGECHGYKESDSDMTDENGKYRLDNYYTNTQGEGWSFSKEGYYTSGSRTGDTVRLSRQ